MSQRNAQLKGAPWILQDFACAMHCLSIQGRMHLPGQNIGVGSLARDEIHPADAPRNQTRESCFKKKTQMHLGDGRLGIPESATLIHRSLQWRTCHALLRHGITHRADLRWQTWRTRIVHLDSQFLAMAQMSRIAAQRCPPQGGPRSQGWRRVPRIDVPSQGLRPPRS